VHLSLTAGPDAELFLKVLDLGPDGATVVGTQVAPVRAPALGGPLAFTVDRDLEPLAHEFPAGHRWALALSTTDDAYSGSRDPAPVVVDLADAWVNFPDA
jgi:ABC-2 type transport system ATP-binding protein